MFSAAVPLDTATACAASCAAANASSNRPLYGPSVSAPLARISVTAAAISARSAGAKTTRAAGTPNAWPLAQLWRGPAGPPLVTVLHRAWSRPCHHSSRNTAEYGSCHSVSPWRARPQARAYEAGVIGVLRQRGPGAGPGTGRVHRGGG